MLKTNACHVSEMCYIPLGILLVKLEVVTLDDATSSCKKNVFKNYACSFTLITNSIFKTVNGHLFKLPKLS